METGNDDAVFEVGCARVNALLKCCYLTNDVRNSWMFGKREQKTNKKHN